MFVALALYICCEIIYLECVSFPESCYLRFDALAGHFFVLSLHFFDPLCVGLREVLGELWEAPKVGMH